MARFRKKKMYFHSVKMTQSIRTKLIIIMIMMMGLVLFALWFMNYALLSTYYEYNKASQLAEMEPEHKKALAAAMREYGIL